MIGLGMPMHIGVMGVWRGRVRPHNKTGVTPPKLDWGYPPVSGLGLPPCKRTGVTYPP